MIFLQIFLFVIIGIPAFIISVLELPLIILMHYTGIGITEDLSLIPRIFKAFDFEVSQSTSYIIRFIALVITIAFGIGISMDISKPKDIYKSYIIDDIESYGIYEGKYDVDAVKEHVSAFFPQEIEDSFSKIKYAFRARECSDGYAYEAYLEFVIEDTDEFDEFVEEYTDGLQKEVFQPDTKYDEYSIVNNLSISVSYNPEHNGYSQKSIKFNKTQHEKILCSREDQRIVFVSIRVSADGLADLSLLNVFFNRFLLDPTEYANTVEYEGRQGF